MKPLYGPEMKVEKLIFWLLQISYVGEICHF